MPFSIGCIPSGCIVLVDHTGLSSRRPLIVRPPTFDGMLEQVTKLFSHMSKVDVVVNLMDTDHKLVEIMPEVWGALAPGPTYLYLTLRNSVPIGMSASLDSAISADYDDIIICDDDELEYPPDIKPIGSVVSRPRSYVFDTDTEFEVKEDVESLCGEHNGFEHRATKIVWAKIDGWPWWPAEAFLDSESELIPGNIRNDRKTAMARCGEKLHTIQFFQYNRVKGWQFVTGDNFQCLGVNHKFDNEKLEEFFAWVSETRAWEDDKYDVVGDFYSAYKKALESQ